MHVFGLTGGIASGKSSVAHVFADEGVPVLDADLVAREVVAPGQPALAELVAHFGTDILLPDRTLHRKALGARVFGNPDAVAFLNATTHPRIAQRTAERLAQFAAQGAPMACYDAALLLEKGLDASFHPVVLVVAPERERLARIMQRDALSELEARARMDAQMSDEDKRPRADYIIENAHSLDELETRARAVLNLVRAKLQIPLQG